MTFIKTNYMVVYDQTDGCAMLLCEKTGGKGHLQSLFHRQTDYEGLWQCWRSSLLIGTFSYVTAPIYLA